MNNQEVSKAFEELFISHFYDDVKFIKYYNDEETNYNYIDIMQGDKKMTIKYNYYESEDIIEHIKLSFGQYYNKFDNIVVSCGGKYIKGINSDEIMTNSCCICLEDYNDNKIKLLCGHSVCKGCIKNINKCPYCRQPLKNDSVSLMYKIKDIVKKGLDVEEEEKEIKKLFDYDEFIKNELTVEKLRLYDLLIYVFGYNSQNITDYKDGKILYSITHGELEFNEKRYKHCLFSLIDMKRKAFEDLKANNDFNLGSNKKTRDILSAKFNFYQKAVNGLLKKSIQ